MTIFDISPRREVRSAERPRNGDANATSVASILAGCTNPPAPAGGSVHPREADRAPANDHIRYKPAARGSLSRAAPKRGRERHERSEYSRRVYRTSGETGRKGFFLRHSAEATQKHKSRKEADPCGSHLFCDLRRHAREARFFGVSMKQIAISAATHSTVPIRMKNTSSMMLPPPDSPGSPFR